MVPAKSVCCVVEGVTLSAHINQRLHTSGDGQAALVGEWDSIGCSVVNMHPVRACVSCSGGPPSPTQDCCRV